MRLKRKIAAALAVIMAFGSVGIMNLEARVYPRGHTTQGVQGAWAGHDNNLRLVVDNSPAATLPTTAIGVDFVVSGANLISTHGIWNEIRLTIGGDGIWNYGAPGINNNANRTTQTAFGTADGPASLPSLPVRTGTQNDDFAFHRDVSIGNAPGAGGSVNAGWWVDLIPGSPGALSLGLLGYTTANTSATGPYQILWAGISNRAFTVDRDTRVVRHWCAWNNVLGIFGGWSPLLPTGAAGPVAVWNNFLATEFVDDGIIDPSEWVDIIADFFTIPRNRLIIIPTTTPGQAFVLGVPVNPLVDNFTRLGLIQLVPYTPESEAWVAGPTPTVAQLAPFDPILGNVQLQQVTQVTVDAAVIAGHINTDRVVTHVGEVTPRVADFLVHQRGVGFNANPDRVITDVITWPSATITYTVTAPTGTPTWGGAAVTAALDGSGTTGTLTAGVIDFGDVAGNVTPITATYDWGAATSVAVPGPSAALMAAFNTTGIPPGIHFMPVARIATPVATNIEHWGIVPVDFVGLNSPFGAAGYFFQGSTAGVGNAPDNTLNAAGVLVNDYTVNEYWLGLVGGIVGGLPAAPGTLQAVPVLGVPMFVGTVIEEKAATLTSAGTAGPAWGFTMADPQNLGTDNNIPVGMADPGWVSPQVIQLTHSISNVRAGFFARDTRLRYTGGIHANPNILNEVPFTMEFWGDNTMIIRWESAAVVAAGGLADAILRIPLAVQATGTGEIYVIVDVQGTIPPSLLGGARQLITDRPISVVVSTIGNVATVQAGSNLHFAASVLPHWNNPQFTWSLQTAHPGVSINSNTGLLTVGANVPEGTQITVRAAINNFNHIFGERTVTVVRPAPPSGGVMFTYPNFSSHSSNPNATVNFNIHTHLTPAGAASGFTTLRYEWLREGNVWQGSGGTGTRTANQIGNPIQLQLPGGTHAQRGGNWALRVSLLDANGNVLFVDNSIGIVLTITQPPGQEQESNQDQGSGGNEPSRTPAPTPTSTPAPTPVPVSTPAPDSWAVSEPEVAPMPWTPGLVLPVVPPTFNDVDQNAWYANYVTAVTSVGLFQGVAEGQFDVESEMTRAMFAQVLANLNGVDLLVFDGMAASFGDVSSDAWYFGAVQWASSLGIVTGTGDGNFDPNTPISREQMAVMLFRFIQIMGIEIPLDVLTIFVDNYAISPWAVEAVATIQAMGIISGRPDGSFDPHTTATRGEVAAIFARFLELVQ